MTWVDVCPLDRLVVDRGVAALVGGEPVALFRLSGDELYAIDHCEPFTGAPVMARGLVGSVGETPTVASPLHKQRFDLRTGACLDAPGHKLRIWPVQVAGGIVQVADRPTCHLNGYHRLNGFASAADSPVDPRRPSDMMTDVQVRLVQDSFARIAPISAQAAAMFYDRLFEIAPDVKPLFSSDLAEQGRKLMMTLGLVVNGLHDVEHLLGTMRELGVRHAVDYGVLPEHYEPVGEALLWMLGQSLGAGFTVEVAAAWSSAYELMAATMISATGQAVR